MRPQNPPENKPSNLNPKYPSDNKPSHRLLGLAVLSCFRLLSLLGVQSFFYCQPQPILKCKTSSSNKPLPEQASQKISISKIKAFEQI